MEQFTQPVQGQNDGQEAAADHPLPVKACRIRLYESCLSRPLVQRSGHTIPIVTLLPSLQTIATPVLTKRMHTVIRWLSPSPEICLVNPSTYMIWISLPPPHQSKWIRPRYVGGKPRRKTPGVMPLPPKVWMSREYYSEQPAARIHPCISQARPNFPIHLPPLPRTFADKHNRHGCLSNEIIPNLPPDFLRPQGIRYVSKPH